jgi:phospholipid/cholesterol/gamma-HCH transport system substrate-binding protein
MESKREQALVGLFVLVAAGLLIATVFVLSGTFDRGLTPYHSFFKNAGGLSAGAEVRYAGGPPVGRVKSVEPDPHDPTRMEIDFTVKPETPLKTDSVVTITSSSPLGDNYLGILAGTNAAPRAQPGATLKSKEYVSFADISASISEMTPAAKNLLNNLNDRVVELRVTIDRVNDMLNDQNRANISASLSNVRGMLEENRPTIRSTLNNLNSSSAKLDKVLDDMKKTMAQANETLSHIDATIGENRPDLRASIQDLRKSMASVAALSDQLDRTLNANSENLDEIIENLRQITENMKSFTDTIKTRPYTLIRASEPKSHEPGQAPPQ